MIARLSRHLVLVLTGLVGPLAVLALGLALIAHDPAPVKGARLAVFDAYQRLAPRPALRTPVRVVDIDAESLRRLGAWPWSHARLAELIRRIDAAGAATIVLALVIDEPDRASPRALVRDLAGLPGVERLRFLVGRLPDPDILLAQAIGAAGAATAMRLNEAPTAEPRLPPDPAWSLAAIGAAPEAFVPRYPDVTAPLPAIALASAGIGAVNLPLDPDGVVRRAPVLLAVDGRIVPSLGAEALRLHQGSGTYVTRTDPDRPDHGLDYLRIGGAVVPTDGRGGLWLHLTAGAPARHVPAWSVMIRDTGPSVADAGLNGALVLIGSSAPGVGERSLTPRGPVADVTLWAEAVEQMLLGNALVRPDWGRPAEIGAVALGGALVLGLIASLGAAAALAIGGTAVVAMGIAGWWLFTAQGLLVDAVGPGAVLLLALVVAAVGRGVRVERERAAVRAAFAHYVAPAVAAELAEDPGHVDLGGEIRPITVMFTDIRGFSAIAETLPPDRMTRLLTDYFTPMTEVVHHHRGTVDKFIGDGLMAFWGAPLPDPDHAEHACRAALAMVDRLDALNADWRAEAAAAQAATPDAIEPIAHRPLDMGIGLNSGDCLVGNIGSRQRFNYTALGDPVNVAARLEDLSKVWRVPILVGPATRAAVPHFAFLALDRVQVAGRHEPTEVHALVGDETVARDPGFAELADAQGDLTTALHAGDRAAARRALDRAEAAAPARLAGLWAVYRAMVEGHGPPPALTVPGAATHARRAVQD